MIAAAFCWSIRIPTDFMCVIVAHREDLFFKQPEERILGCDRASAPSRTD
jgi:hypothetical protein